MSPFIVHIAIITILDIAGSLCAKYYSIHKHPSLLVATFILFGTAGYVFAKSLSYEGLAITNVLWITLSILFITIISYFAFNEEISHIQILGIVIIMVGLILINWK